MYINCKYSLNQNHKFYARRFFSFIPFLRLLCVDLFLLFMYRLKCIKKKIFYERKTVNKIKNRINYSANMQYLWTTRRTNGFINLAYFAITIVFNKTVSNCLKKRCVCASCRLK